MRAVIYCRCSTEEDTQINALEKQVAEAKNIVHIRGWTLVDTYVESKSGTTTKDRKEYNRLYRELLTDKFDIVCIKSQDRLARNVKDWYLFTDRLNTEKKKLFLYLENKWYSQEDALINGIKAILAEEYSRELSKKINHAHRNRQQNNGNIILSSNAYGFRRRPDKSIELVENEVAIKKKMYELCAEGYGTRKIAEILQNDGIENRSGKPFSAQSILRIIRNPINRGAALMNRTHFDFDTKKTVINPTEAQFIYENKVQKTVSDDLWFRANAQIDKRSTQNQKDKKVRGKYFGKYALSKKIICGICGEPYYRRTRKKYKDGERIYFWTCKNYLDHGRNVGKTERLQKAELKNTGGCENIHLDEEKFLLILREICMERYRVEKEQIILELMAALREIFIDTNFSEMNQIIKRKEKLENQKDKLLDKFLEEMIASDLYMRKQKQIEEELETIENKIKKYERRTSQEKQGEYRIREIESILQGGMMIEEASTRGMLEKITKIVIYPEEMELYFPCTGRREAEELDLLETKITYHYGHLFNFRQQQKDALEQVVEYMKNHPAATAKEMASAFNLSVSGMQQRITKLKKQEKIRFIGKGGKGHWEVLY